MTNGIFLIIAIIVSIPNAAAWSAKPNKEIEKKTCNVFLNINSKLNQTPKILYATIPIIKLVFLEKDCVKIVIMNDIGIIKNKTENK